MAQKSNSKTPKDDEVIEPVYPPDTILPASKDWRRAEVTSWGLKMMLNCDSCPICNAMLCGSEDHTGHENWHASIESRLVALEEKNK